ncbi:MAG TPA: hypothetical protein VJL90_10935 [Pseudorhodoplanes sp.]|nr:hypothetical protein [Pseudorhodoplanes sp.]
MAVSKYGSYRTMTAYESATAWAAKRKAARQKFEAAQSEISNKLLSVGDAQSQGLAEIVAKIALKRITEEGKVQAEKNAALAKFATEVDTDSADKKESVFSGDSSATLDGGTQINLDTNELVLSDGTTIDIKTGLKKVKVNVTV